ncbi:MAG: hypothetical protein RJA36_3909 [Pseudomonadota bacterium]|jgi:transcriptional regulator with XRE-family HTH domain
MAPYVVAMRTAWRDSGLTIHQIAARAGVSENTAIAVLGGRNAHMSSVQAICAVLNIRALEFVASTSCGH